MKLIPRAINTGFRSEIKLKHNVLRILHWLIPQPPSSTANHAILRDELHNTSPAMAVLLSGSKDSAHSGSLFLLFTIQLLTFREFHICQKCVLIIFMPLFVFLPPSRTTTFIHSHIHVLLFSFLNNLLSKVYSSLLR